MLQKLPVNKFGWIEENYKFDESFIKHYNEKRDEGCFVKIDVQYPKKLQRKNDNQKCLKTCC